MNLHEFTKLATRTESPYQEFKAPRMLLEESLKAYIAAGNMLDQIKKYAFYGSQFDLPKYQHTLKQLSQQLTDAAANISELGIIVVDANTTPDTTYLNVNPRTVHALIGMNTESTELAQVLLNYLQTGAVDI